MIPEVFHTYQTDQDLDPGWYYRISPESAPVGPFETETAAEKARPIIFYRDNVAYMAPPEVHDRLNRLWCGLYMDFKPMAPYHTAFARALAQGEIKEIAP